MEISSILQSFALPLPLYNSVRIGEALSKDGDQFSIHAGLNREHAKRLKELSLDENDSDLQKNTSDRERFGEGSYEEWYAKSRTPFALVHTATNDLAGIAWFGPKPLGRKSLKHLTDEELALDEKSLDAGNWHTISYRCYPNFRGKGLMKAFVGFSMDLYVRSIPDVRLWAGINTENTASDALALSLGFRPLEEISDRQANWLVMVKE